MCCLVEKDFDSTVFLIGGGACAADLYYKLLKVERIAKQMAHVTSGSSVAAVNAAVSKVCYYIFSSCMQGIEVALAERSFAFFFCLH